MTAVLAYVVAASIAIGGGALGNASLSGDMTYGDQGSAVATLNDALSRAGFHPDAGDVFGERTRFAVYGFQKHHGLAVTGRFTPFMWDLLDDPITLPRRPESDRVEVDLGKQVLYVVQGDEVVLVVPVSSGNGDPYIGSNGRRQVANTPEGVFRFQRRILGIRKAPLGTLYNPFYFRGGIAIHGSPSVPNFPASHGCIRTTMWDMDLLLDHLEVGQTIYVYGARRVAPSGGSTTGVTLLLGPRKCHPNQIRWNPALPSTRSEAPWT